MGPTSTPVSFCTRSLAAGIVVLGVLAASWAPPLAPQANSTTTTAAGSLSGTWKFGVQNNNGTVSLAEFELIQDGNRLKGKGHDDGGDFVLGGLREGERVRLCKTYPNNTVARPVRYLGMIDWVRPNSDSSIPYNLHIAGQWVTEKRAGSGWRSRIVIEHNSWEAARPSKV